MVELRSNQIKLGSGRSLIDGLINRTDRFDPVFKILEISFHISFFSYSRERRIKGEREKEKGFIIAVKLSL